MKWAFLLLALLTLGCASNRQRYVEGTHLVLGAYLPCEDSLYGIEIVQFTSGAYLNTSTNTPVKFEREYASTNSYLWGMVQTREWSKSKVEVEKK